MLVSLLRNPVQLKPMEQQIAYHKIPIKKRALCTQLAKHTKGGRMYKMAFVKKEISEANEENRTIYGKTHYWDTIKSFWQYQVFTDEAHIDPTSFRAREVLREEGHRYDPENILQRGEKKGVKLHCAAWVNWHAKSERLHFYHNKEEYTTKPKIPRKPR